MADRDASYGFFRDRIELIVQLERRLGSEPSFPAGVIEAANNQWVKLPKACPAARLRFGKISLINTQITAPWPMA